MVGFVLGIALIGVFFFIFFNRNLQPRGSGEEKSILREQAKLHRENEKDKQKIFEIENEKRLKSEQRVKNLRENSGGAPPKMIMVLEDSDPQPFDGDSFGTINVKAINLNDHKIRKSIIDLGFTNADLEIPDHEIDMMYKRKCLRFQIERERNKFNNEFKGDNGENFRVNLN